MTLPAVFEMPESGLHGRQLLRAHQGSGCGQIIFRDHIRSRHGDLPESRQDSGALRNTHMARFIRVYQPKPEALAHRLLGGVGGACCQ